MIADALKYLTELARGSSEPQELGATNDREAYYAIGGKVEKFDVPPAPRDHHVSMLADLIRLANDNEDDAGSLWCNESAVVLVMDDTKHRIERATLDLEPSGVFKTLTDLEKKAEWIEHKPFIRLLRIGLASAIEPVQLLNKVKRVQFDQTASTTSHVTRQSESLGRNITAKVETAEGELPETVVLSVPVYRTVGENTPYPVRCSVEVDSGLGAFRLLPLPDELARVQQTAMGSIRERIEASTAVPAYYGRP